MQRFHLPGGDVIAFSNGAMWSLYFVLYAATSRRTAETDEEDAVVEWLRERWSAMDGYAYAFALDPVEADIAAPRRLAYLAELIRVSADDLAREGEPDELIWMGEVAWDDARRADWLDRLDRLAVAVERARFALVTAPRAGTGPW